MAAGLLVSALLNICFGLSATVTALTPLRTLTITAWNFKPLLREHPQITYKLLLQLCARLREAEGRTAL